MKKRSNAQKIILLVVTVLFILASIGLYAETTAVPKPEPESIPYPMTSEVKVIGDYVYPKMVGNTKKQYEKAVDTDVFKMYMFEDGQDLTFVWINYKEEWLTQGWGDAGEVIRNFHKVSLYSLKKNLSDEWDWGLKQTSDSDLMFVPTRRNYNDFVTVLFMVSVVFLIAGTITFFSENK